MSSDIENLLMQRVAAERRLDEAVVKLEEAETEVRDARQAFNLADRAVIRAETLRDISTHPDGIKRTPRKAPE